MYIGSLFSVFVAAEMCFIVYIHIYILIIYLSTIQGKQSQLHNQPVSHSVSPAIIREE